MLKTARLTPFDIFKGSKTVRHDHDTFEQGADRFAIGCQAAAGVKAGDDFLVPSQRRGHRFDALAQGRAGAQAAPIEGYGLSGGAYPRRHP